MYDGSVFIEAEGDEISLDHFLIWCKEGPSFARVEKLTTIQGTIKNYTAFSVRS